MDRKQRKQDLVRWEDLIEKFGFNSLYLYLSQTCPYCEKLQTVEDRLCDECTCVDREIAGRTVVRGAS